MKTREYANQISSRLAQHQTAHRILYSIMDEEKKAPSGSSKLFSQETDAQQRNKKFTHQLYQGLVSGFPLSKSSGTTDMKFVQILQTLDQEPDAKKLSPEDDVMCLLSATMSWFPEYLQHLTHLRDKLNLVDPLICLPQFNSFSFQYDKPEIRNKKFQDILAAVRAELENPRFTVEREFDRLEEILPFLNESEIDTIIQLAQEFLNSFLTKKTHPGLFQYCLYLLDSSCRAANLAVILIKLLVYTNDQQQLSIAAQLKTICEKTWEAIKPDVIMQEASDLRCELQRNFHRYKAAAFNDLVGSVNCVMAFVSLDLRKVLTDVLKWSQPHETTDISLETAMTLATMHQSGWIQDESLCASINKPLEWKVVYRFRDILEVCTPMTHWPLWNICDVTRSMQQLPNQDCNTLMTKITLLANAQDARQFDVKKTQCARNSVFLMRYCVRIFFDRINADLQQQALTRFLDPNKMMRFNCGFLLPHASNPLEKIRGLLSDHVHCDKVESILLRLWADDTQRRNLLMKTLAEMRQLPPGVMRLAASYV
jgi:hypothetical protein